MAEIFGKKRATVKDINDPQKRGRVRCSVPNVLGDSLSGWCEPSMSDAFGVPPVGSGVWVEFEDGDVNKPVYSGSWCPEGSAPGGGNPGKRIVQQGKAIISLSDGGVEITFGGQKVTLTETGVQVSTPTGQVFIGENRLAVACGSSAVILRDGELDVTFNDSTHVTLSESIALKIGGTECIISEEALTKLDELLNGGSDKPDLAAALSGGATGDVLTKKDVEDYSFEWKPGGGA